MMNNPLFNMFSNSQFRNMQGMINHFNQFKRTFKGDARQQVQDMLNSGEISQAQYDQAVQMAKSLQSMLK